MSARRGALRAAGALALAALLATGGAAAARAVRRGAGPASDAGGPRTTVLHRARAGETYAGLASEYYGNRQLAVFILAANGQGHPRPLRAGERVRIPTTARYVVKAGDTLARLARRFLGDERRAPYLATFNSLQGTPELAPGAELAIPFHIVHRAADTEPLAAIARAFFGDASAALLLKSYNFRDSATLKRGESIIVPITHVRVRASKLSPPPASASPAARETHDPKRIAEGLAEAERRFADGRYEELPPLLFELTGFDPDERELAELHRLLGFAYVALGQEAIARRHLGEALARRPDLTLDPATVSPKLRQALESARGAALEEGAAGTAGAHEGGAGARPGPPRP